MARSIDLCNTRLRSARCLLGCKREKLSRQSSLRRISSDGIALLQATLEGIEIKKTGRWKAKLETNRNFPGLTQKKLKPKNVIKIIIPDVGELVG
jgi:hypothetical protein